MSYKYSLSVFILFNVFVINAQISWNMDLLSHWDDEYILDRKGVKYNDIWGYVDCDNTEYAIMGSQEYIHFFNLSNPENIKEVGRIHTNNKAIWRDFKTYKNFAYAIADEGTEGLLIINLHALPSQPEIVFQDNNTFQKAHNIFIDEPNARLYVAGSNTQRNGLIVYDISEPDQAKIIGRPNIGDGNYVHDVYVRDHIAYCSQGWDGFNIWDYSDAQNPQLMAYLETIGYNHSSWVTGDGKYAFFAEEIPKGVPIGVVDISGMEEGEIELVDEFIMPLIEDSLNVTPHNPFVVGDFLVISYYEDGVQVFDISDPENAVKVAYYDTAPENTQYNGTRNNWGVYPFFPSKTIIASDTKNGLFVMRPSLNAWLGNEMDLSEPDCSQLAPVEISVGGIEGLKEYYLYQNGNSLEIYLHFNKDNNFDFYLYNTNGQLLKEFSHNGIGIFDYEMEIGNYSTGVYYMTIIPRDGDTKHTIPFIKQ